MSGFQALTVARVFPFLFRPSQTLNQTTMADAEALQKLRDENAAMEKEIMELTKKSDTVGTKSASISPPNSSIQVLKFEKGFSAGGAGIDNGSS